MPTEAATRLIVDDNLRRLLYDARLESGLTIFNASSTPGANRYNPANTRRSMLLKVSDCGDLRRSTLS
jgi:hypothetical protein